MSLNLFLTLEIKKVNTEETWKTYQTVGIIKDNDMLSAMLGDVVTTIKNFEKMYGIEQSKLIVVSLMRTYMDLSLMAFHRNMNDCPTL